MLTLQEGQMFDNQYRLEKLIDNGGFAEVWRACYVLANTTVALKIYPRLDDEGINTIEAEYRKLFELQHQNLMHVFQFGKINGYPYLVLKYYAGGNASAKMEQYTEPEIALCLQQISSALKFLHANDFVHQDIKPNNFLLDRNGNFYLADLGLSVKLRKTINHFTKKMGSDISSLQNGQTPPPYRASELWDRSREDNSPIKATDVWALGASLYEMITGNFPYGDLGGLTQKHNPYLVELPENFSAGLTDIINKCLAVEPWDRPTASKLEKWASDYLETGVWDGQTATQPGDIRPSLTAEVVPSSKPKMSKAVIIILLAVVLVGAFGYVGIRNNWFSQSEQAKNTVADTNATVKPDSSLTTDNNSQDNTNTTPRKETPTTKTVSKEVKKDTAKYTPAAAADNSQKSTVGTNILRGGSGKNSSEVSIARIIQGAGNLRVVFDVSDCDADNIMLNTSDHAIYIKPTNGGAKAYLVSVFKGGSTVTAVFQNVSDNTHEIDIVDPSLDRGIVRFNFNNITINK